MAQFLPNAWPSLGKTYYVAQKHPAASDTNPGTQSLPFKTISAAAKVVEPYDRVLIDEGIYREQVPVFRHGHPYYPGGWIVFEAVRGKEVCVKGSDVFEAEWQDLGGGVHAAALPRHLFEEGTYNPYELPCRPRPNPHAPLRGAYCLDDAAAGAPDVPEKVRPAQGDRLPETLGQIYVDGVPLEQLDSLEAVRETPGSFIVSADGKQILCHFMDGRIPEGKLVELTVRERCFKPMFPVPPSGLMIRTVGILAEHAADPGAFSLCRPLMIRRNRRSGITVRKTLHVLNRLPQGGVLRSNVSYLSPHRPTVLCRVRDGTRPLPPDKLGTVTLVSDDGAKTWKRIESGPLTERMANYFLDEESGMLLRYYREPSAGGDGGEAGGRTQRRFYQQVSHDGGATWSSPEPLDFNERTLCYRIIKLRSGRLFWITSEDNPELSPLFRFKHESFFFLVKTWLGTWRDDLSGVDWEHTATLSVNPEKGVQGLDEPQACQLPDGKIFAVFRQCGSLPSQTTPGFPTVKMYAVSEDEGRTWTEPAPLTFEDGTYVYSSVSFASAFCSSKNGRAYVILNILNRPFEGCLPRTALHIAEIDQETFAVKRDTITVIEEEHEEHSHLVGYSNWDMLEERSTKNLLLFMKLENGPVYDGYDWNSYRYEIELPE